MVITRAHSVRLESGMRGGGQRIKFMSLHVHTFLCCHIHCFVKCLCHLGLKFKTNMHFEAHSTNTRDNHKNKHRTKLQLKMQPSAVWNNASVLTSTTSEDSELSRCLTGMHRYSRLMVFLFSVIRSKWKADRTRTKRLFTRCAVVVISYYCWFLYIFSSFMFIYMIRHSRC